MFELNDQKRPNQDPSPMMASPPLMPRAQKVSAIPLHQGDHHDDVSPPGPDDPIVSALVGARASYAAAYAGGNSEHVGMREKIFGYLNEFEQQYLSMTPAQREVVQQEMLGLAPRSPASRLSPLSDCITALPSGAFALASPLSRASGTDSWLVGFGLAGAIAGLMGGGVREASSRLCPGRLFLQPTPSTDLTAGEVTRQTAESVLAGMTGFTLSRTLGAGITTALGVTNPVVATMISMAASICGSVATQQAVRLGSRTAPGHVSRFSDAPAAPLVPGPAPEVLARVLTGMRNVPRFALAASFLGGCLDAFKFNGQVNLAAPDRSVLLNTLKFCSALCIYFSATNCGKNDETSIESFMTGMLGLSRAKEGTADWELLALMNKVADASPEDQTMFMESLLSVPRTRPGQSETPLTESEKKTLVDKLEAAFEKLKKMHENPAPGRINLLGQPQQTVHSMASPDMPRGPLMSEGDLLFSSPGSPRPDDKIHSL